MIMEFVTKVNKNGNIKGLVVITSLKMFERFNQYLPSCHAITIKRKDMAKLVDQLRGEQFEDIT